MNIGAGSITANYDGRDVYRTNIGNDCYIGSGSVLIAPLDVRDGSHIASGTVVSQENVNTLGGETKKDVSGGS